MPGGSSDDPESDESRQIQAILKHWLVNVVTAASKSEHQTIDDEFLAEGHVASEAAMLGAWAPLALDELVLERFRRR